MKRCLQKNRNQLVASFFLSILLVFTVITPLHTEASKKVREESDLSGGVHYKEIDYKEDGINGRVNMMEIDASDAFTEVKMSKAHPLDNLATVRQRAEPYHLEERRIVGAINANFFKMEQGKETRPVHLISEDNRLVYGGFVNDDKNGLVNEPIAFGMDKNGKGLIDSYNLNLTYTYNGKTEKIKHTNRERAKNNMILYTNDFYKDDTDTNKHGTEVVLKGSGNPELTLGSTIELQVEAIRKKGDKNPTPISDDSFVLSGHGKSSDKLKKMKIGDTIALNTNMDQQWHESEFMLAGGPQLVKNGNVDISMNTDSWAAKNSTSRTIVGVDGSRDKVFYVTVDTSINDGMNMSEAARLMKDLGADTALNLDGGGSTTMAIRPDSNAGLKVANKLQDGVERGVSAILMAADTEPERIFKDVSARDDLYDGILWAKDNGSITGYEDNTFKPHKSLSRKHGAAIFSRTFNLDTSGGSDVGKQFSDIKPSHEYAGEIAAAGKSKIFTGENGQFLPEDTLTREQMASTIVRAFGWEESATHEADVSMKKVDDSHRESVQILADKKITTELDDFRPREAVTRGQFANFLQRANENE